MDAGRALLAGALLGTALMTGCGGSGPPDLCSLLPREVQGWHASEPDRLYDADTLYEYIDGGAEVYRALNVRTVCARTYTRESSPEITADLFEMGSSADAFGAWHHDLREGQPAGVGQESELTAGSLAFWKGRYFVSILLMDEDEEAGRAVLELGRLIATAIPEAGSPPAIVKSLPDQGLLASQVRYFHSHVALYAHYDLAEGNPLGLGQDTEGLLAHYEPADEADATPYAVLLVRYPSAERARSAAEGFRRRYAAGADDRGVAEDDEGRWAGVRLVGQLLVAVLDAPSQARALEVLEAVAKRGEGGSQR